MSDSINEQRCEHGKTHKHPIYDEYGVYVVALCPGPSVVTPPAQDEQRRNYCGHESTHAPHLNCVGYQVEFPFPAAPSVSTDRTDERRAALTDLEHALTLALQAMADNDCCADPDDPDWRGPAIEQFRRDLIALGVTSDELDECGISEAGRG